MMITSPSASAPYAAASALDRAPRSDTDPAADAGSPRAGPDVVVSLSGGAPPPPATYDASGRMDGAPTPEGGGHAPASADAASVDEEAAVPA